MALFLYLVFFSISCGQEETKEETSSTSSDNQTTTDNKTTNTDTTPPVVFSTSPSDNDTSVSVNSTISVTFSESMDYTSVRTTQIVIPVQVHFSCLPIISVPV